MSLHCGFPLLFRAMCERHQEIYRAGAFAKSIHSFISRLQTFGSDQGEKETLDTRMKKWQQLD